MSNTTTETKPWTIGMDMTVPYGVYLRGELVGEYATQEKATEHYERLRTDEREARQKRLDTLRAQFALAGHTLHTLSRADDDRVTYIVSRWGQSRAFTHMHDLESFLVQIGGSHE